MKVYLFYLTLPEEREKLYDMFEENIVDNFLEVFPSLSLLTKRFNNENNNWTYLYALTNNSMYANIFEETHDMKLFKKIVKNIEKEEYEQLRKENILSELDWRKCYDEEYSIKEKTKIDIIAPKVEFYEIHDTISYFITNMIFENTIMEYSQFKDEYIKALDFLMYCTENKIHSEDAEFYQYNYSYGCTAEGYVLPNKHASIRPHYIKVYTKLYSLLLRKAV